jgi:GT2 family glycosyltransferase
MTAGDRLSFSVIVPTRNRPAALERCLASLAAQSYAGDSIEVVVVDDGSVPPVTAPFATTDRLSRCVLVSTPGVGPAAARNAGVAASHGDALAFIDDDCIADPGWLTALAVRLCAQPGAAVGGRVQNALTGNRYARASQSLIGFLYRYYHVEGRGSVPFFTTNNLAVRRDVFEDVGPFDPSFPFASEDRDWSDRCRYGGRALCYAEEALVFHANELSWRSFLRQHFRYGEGALRFHRARARRRREPMGMESPRFYASMFWEPFATHDPQAFRQVGLLLTSQVASAAGFADAYLRGVAHRRGPSRST